MADDWNDAEVAFAQKCQGKSVEACAGQYHFIKQRFSSDVSKPSLGGWTVLHWWAAAKSARDVHILLWLLSEGADPRARATDEPITARERLVKGGVEGVEPLLLTILTAWEAMMGAPENLDISKAFITTVVLDGDDMADERGKRLISGYFLLLASSIPNKGQVLNSYKDHLLSSKYQEKFDQLNSLAHFIQAVEKAADQAGPLLQAYLSLVSTDSGSTRAGKLKAVIQEMGFDDIKDLAEVITSCNDMGERSGVVLLDQYLGLYQRHGSGWGRRMKQTLEHLTSSLSKENLNPDVEKSDGDFLAFMEVVQDRGSVGVKLVSQYIELGESGEGRRGREKLNECVTLVKEDEKQVEFMAQFMAWAGSRDKGSVCKLLCEYCEILKKKGKVTMEDVSRTLVATITMADVPGDLKDAAELMKNLK